MAVETGETEIARLLYQARPHRPADLNVPAGNLIMQDLVSKPPPFKIRSLMALCWVVIGKDRLLEKEARQRGIPHFA